MAYKKDVPLTDRDGNVMYPRTTADSVHMKAGPEGKTLDQLFSGDSANDALKLEGRPAWEYRKGENLLINSRWKNQDAVINQRGQTEYTGAIYGIDGWRSNGSGYKMSLQEEGIKLENVSSVSQGYPFYQIIESAQALAGKRITFSVLAEAPTTGEASVSIRFATSSGYHSAVYVPITSAGVTSASGVFPQDATILWCGILFSKSVAAGTGILLKAAKLELGSTQTLAHQDEEGNWILNDPPPNYALELAKCQRYQLMIKSDQFRVTTVGTNKIFFSIPTPVTMRITPQISVNGLSVKSISGATQDGFVFNIFHSDNNLVGIEAAKNDHKMTDAYLNAGAGTILDANL